MKVYQTHPTDTREEEKRGPHPIFQTTMAQFVPDSTTENGTSLKQKNITYHDFMNCITR
jgi:hypothetical protein